MCRRACGFTGTAAEAKGRDETCSQCARVERKRMRRGARIAHHEPGPAPGNQRGPSHNLTTGAKASQRPLRA